jgi:hypothetical protein
MLRLRDGEDINMVPYSLSPLSLPDMVKSLGNEVVSIDEEKNITYDPSTVEFTFVRVYQLAFVVLPLTSIFLFSSLHIQSLSQCI